MPFTRRTGKFSSTRRTGSTTNTGSGYRSGNTFSTWSNSWTPTATFAPTKFVQHRNEINCKIGSFRTINEQVTGSSKVVAFSPSLANRWINYVNDGCYVYKFNNNEFVRSFGRYFGKQNGTFSTGTTLRTLQRQFGAGIKAIARGKGNNWLICASQNVNKGPFSSYWK